jgi:hypothetical protein
VHLTLARSTRATSSSSTPWSKAACAPSRTAAATRPARACCRCSSTATRLHRPGRRRRDAQPQRASRATARAAPCTSSSTTRWASPPTPKTRAPPLLHRHHAHAALPRLPRERRGPEAVAQVARLAADYRQRFGRDVVIDLYCYRKYGHNEGDEPRFTQPLMYAAIDQKRTVREVYIEKLVELGKITRQQATRHREPPRAAFLDTRSTRRAAAASRSSRRHGRACGTTVQGRPRRGRARVNTGVPAREAGGAARQAHHGARGLHAAPALSASCSTSSARSLKTGRGRLGHRREPRARHAPARGHPLPPHRPGRAPRHVQPPPRRHLRLGDGHALHALAGLAPRTRRASRSWTARSARPACWASSGATRSTTPTRSSCGRRSSATS